MRAPSSDTGNNAYPLAPIDTISPTTSGVSKRPVGMPLTAVTRCFSIRLIAVRPSPDTASRYSRSFDGLETSQLDIRLEKLFAVDFDQNKEKRQHRRRQEYAHESVNLHASQYSQKKQKIG